MKTDTIFYKLFQEFPNIFFELIGKLETNTNLYEFKSQEIKETGFRIAIQGALAYGITHPTGLSRLK